jgi:hypothetical protein
MSRQALGSGRLRPTDGRFAGDRPGVDRPHRSNDAFGSRSMSFGVESLIVACCLRLPCARRTALRGCGRRMIGLQRPGSGGLDGSRPGNTRDRRLRPRAAAGRGSRTGRDQCIRGRVRSRGPLRPRRGARPTDGRSAQRGRKRNGVARCRSAARSGRRSLPAAAWRRDAAGGGGASLWGSGVSARSPGSSPTVRRSRRCAAHTVRRCCPAGAACASAIPAHDA